MTGWARLLIGRATSTWNFRAWFWGPTLDQCDAGSILVAPKTVAMCFDNRVRLERACLWYLTVEKKLLLTIAAGQRRRRRWMRAANGRRASC
jgi:hypothetical protein